MSEYDNIIVRLQEHAGLALPGRELNEDRLAAKIYAIKKGVFDTNFNEEVEDILLCLDRINRIDQSAVAGAANAVPGSLVYAMSGIQMLFTELLLQIVRSNFPRSTLLHEVVVAAWQIGCAWDALLAGDIEDIRQHLELEAEARGIKMKGEGERGHRGKRGHRE